MNVKIMGADQSVTNKSGNNYVIGFAASTSRSRLYKLSISPLAGATDLFVWVFDTAGGSVFTSIAPVAVRFVPAGYADTWDFNSDGSLFQHGIYVALSTVAPTDATTLVTSPSANTVIVKADIRVG